MPIAQQSFRNAQKCPIYISIEPNPECYELEPDDELTLIFEAPKRGNGLEIVMCSPTDLIIWPGEWLPEPIVFINGENAEGRSWKFKHKP